MIFLGILLTLVGTLPLQAQGQTVGGSNREAIPWPEEKAPPGPPGIIEEFNLRIPPAFPEPDSPELSLEALKPQEGDTDVIATLGSEQLTRGEVRVAAFLLRRSAPELTPDEAFRHALFKAVANMVYWVEATEQGMIFPLEEAVKISNEQRELCKLSQECMARTTATMTALNLTEDEFWAAERYQRDLTAELMAGKMVAGMDPNDTQTHKAAQELQKQLLSTAPIRWLDPELERKFPSVIAGMKPVILHKHVVEIFDAEVQ